MENLYKHFRENIDPGSQDLMDELEEFSGTKLEVEMRKDGVPAMGSYPDQKIGRISLDKMNFSRHSAYHELLHLYRFWVLRVPKLLGNANTRAYEKIIYRTESSIDHPIMASSEAKQGYSPKAYWSKEMEDGRALDALLRNPPSPERDHGILMMLIYRDTLDRPIYRRMVNAIRKVQYRASHLEARAEAIVSLLSEEKKIEAISTIFNAIGLPTSDLLLRYHDIKQRRWIHEPFPLP